MSICWGCFGYSLIGANEQMTTLHLAKNSRLISANTPGLAQEVVLLDKHAVYFYKDWTLKVTSMMKHDWLQVPFPAVYALENGPARFFAKRDSWCCVVGQNGFILYNQQTHSWKRFRIQEHEEAIQVTCPPVFLSSHKLLCCLKNTLRVWDIHDSLTMHGLQSVETGNVVCMSVYDLIVVYTQDNVLMYYSKELSLLSTWSLDVVLLNAFDVISLDIYPIHMNKSKSDSTAPLILLQRDKLSLLQKEQQTWLVLDLAVGIESYTTWVSEGSSGLYNTLWAFTGSSCLGWFNLFVDTPWQEDVRRPMLFNVDSWDVNVQQGLLMGVEADWNATTWLFLPTVVQTLLERDGMEVAVAFANAYTEYPYFGHAMERILHATVEREYPKAVHLRKVLQFLKSFPKHWHEILVVTARKMEYSVWSFLFEQCESARELFEQVLERGELRLAMQYLIVVQTLEPASVSGPLQVRLLEATLEAEAFHLTGEVVRYLSSAHVESPGKGDYASQFSHRVDTLVPVSVEEEQTFYIDILVSRYARRWMQQMQIRTVGKLAKAVRFPLVEWFWKERLRSCALKELKPAFRALHVQFEWAYPSDEWARLASPVSPRRGMSRDRSVSLGSASEVLARRSISDWTAKVERMDLHQEIR